MCMTLDVNETGDGPGLVFRDGHLLVQRVLPEERPARVVPATRPGAGKRTDCMTQFHSWMALIMGTCPCACSDSAGCEKAVPPSAI